MPRKKNTTQMYGFGSNDESGTQIPTQAQSIVEGSGSVMVSEFKPVPDVDYLQVSVAGSHFFFFLFFLMAMKLVTSLVLLLSFLEKEIEKTNKLTKCPQLPIRTGFNSKSPDIETNLWITFY